MNSREQKKELRMKLYALMAQNDEWYKDTHSELYQQITTVGQQLGMDVIKWKQRDITKEDYLRYRREGLTMVEIAERFNVSKSTLRIWRERNFM